jgi:hypothetical protein
VTVDRVRTLFAIATVVVVAPFAIVAIVATINLFNRF